jgi:hypothetical protein
MCRLNLVLLGGGERRVSDRGVQLQPGLWCLLWMKEKLASADVKTMV